MLLRIRFLLKNLKGRRWMLAVGLILSGLSSVLVVFVPFLTKYVVDDAIRGQHHELLVPLLLACCLAILLKTLLHSGCVFFMELASQHMQKNLRMTIFTNIQYQEMAFFKKMTSGDIITRVTGDLEYVRHFTAYVTYVTVDVIVTFLAAVITLSLTSWKLTLCMLAVSPLVVLTSFLYSKKVRPIYRGIRSKLSKINTAATENIAGNKVVKAFAREDFECEKFDACSVEFREANLKASYEAQKIVPIIEFLAQILSMVTILVGSLFVINGSITLGDLTLFTGLTWAIQHPINLMSPLLNDYHRFDAAIEKVIELCYARPLIVDRHDAVDKKDRFSGKIEFRNVKFGYDDKTILNDISFTVEPGETLAIMGSTGSGKTTIANLIMRFYEAEQGQVLLDDVDVRRRTLKSIHGATAIATQDVFLFSDTIEGNIAFCDVDMPNEQVENCARLASAHDFILKTEDGYDTIIGERGVGLSGGQRQRLALARALAARPAILILDDTTSALDMETEQEIQKNLKNLPFECTKVIIAQRISSVRSADKIIILENGKIDIGTHEELYYRNNYYREVCDLQDEPAPLMNGKDGE